MLRNSIFFGKGSEAVLACIGLVLAEYVLLEGSWVVLMCGHIGYVCVYVGVNEVKVGCDKVLGKFNKM